MTAPTPTPTYHTAGRSRRAFLVGAGSAVVLAGAGLALWGTGVLGGDGDTSTAGGDGDGGGSGDRADDADRTNGLGTGGDGDSDGDGIDPRSSYSSVAMVGDSITEGSAAALGEVLADAGFSDVQIQGKASRRIEVGDGRGAPLSGIRTMFDMISQGVAPEAWVIALGTNDVGQYAEAADYQRLIDAMVTMLPEDQPLVWVDVYRPEYLDDSRLFNELLRERLDARGNAVVADWFSRAGDAELDILRSDGIHPNQRGNLVFAALVADALAELAD